LLSLYVRYHEEEENDPELQQAGRDAFKELESGEEEAARLGDELRSVEAALAEESQAMQAAESEAATAAQAVRALEAKREQDNAALVEVLTRIARSEDRLAGLDDRRADLDRRLRSADEVLSVQQSEAARADQEQRQLEEGLRNLLAERDRLMGAVRDALERHERHRRVGRAEIDTDAETGARHGGKPDRGASQQTTGRGRRVNARSAAADSVWRTGSRRLSSN